MYQLCIDNRNIQPCAVKQLCHRHMVISSDFYDHAGLTGKAFSRLASSLSSLAV